MKHLIWVCWVAVSLSLHATEHQHTEQRQAAPIPAAHQHPELPAEAAQVTRYVCPMHPEIVRNEPGNCPICGMNLEPVSLSAGGDIQVAVGGQLQQTLGLRTAPAERRTLWRYLETVGTIGYNEDQLSHIHPRVSGWIEKLYVASEGQRVTQGQKLYEIYSPELIVAQDEFRHTLRTVRRADDPRGEELIAASRTRLRLLGLSERVIKQVEQQDRTLHTVPFFATHAGVVSELKVRDGMYVEPRAEMMTLIDLSSVWLIADLFEAQQRWFSAGRPVELDLPSVGIHGLETEIDYLYPELDPVTRSLRARLVLPNPDGQLRPGMIADLRLYGGPRRDVLTVPAEALIVTGQSNRVIVQTAHGFSQREVTVGMMSQGYAEIEEGLQPGERVVTSGQFLLDSEANLRASISRLQGAAAPHAQHQH